MTSTATYAVPQAAPAAPAVACSACSLRDLCLPLGLSDAELDAVDVRLVASRRTVPRGRPLFQRHDPFDALYAVWTGVFKTRVSGPDRVERVTGFQMGGELIGLDAIASGRFQVDAVALEDAQVCVIPFDVLQGLANELPPLQQQFHRILSREIERKQVLLLLLGGAPAERRVAAFLLDLAHRLRARGYSASTLVLRMTRREIGSLLGLTLETVSRTLSNFQTSGLVFVRTRHLHIADPAGLQRLHDQVQ